MKNNLFFMETKIRFVSERIELCYHGFQLLFSILIVYNIGFEKLPTNGAIVIAIVCLSMLQLVLMQMVYTIQGKCPAKVFAKKIILKHEYKIKSKYSAFWWCYIFLLILIYPTLCIILYFN